MSRALIERNELFYGNTPNDETEHKSDDKLWKAFEYWLSLIRKDLTEVAFKKYLSKRETVFRDFAKMIEDRLDDLMKLW